MEEFIQKIKAFFGWNNNSAENAPNGIKAKIIEYHPLTPIENADCKVYFDALKNALEHKDVKNIAVTGPYGSGKSSMIRSFFANYNRDEKYKPITITLANFEANVNAKLNNNDANQKPKPPGGAMETKPDSLFQNKGLSDVETITGKKEETEAEPLVQPTPTKSHMQEQKELHANAYVQWSENEDKELKRLYEQGFQIKDLSIIFQRNTGSISSRLKKLGLR